MTMTKQGNEPSHALAVAGDSPFRMALEPHNFEAAYRLAAMAAKIQLCGVTTPEDALVRMMTGRELGLTAFQSMRLVYVVEGRPSLDASLMLALCLGHPECECFELVETDDKKATYRAKRRGRKEVVLSWTIEQAQRAQLLDRGKDPAKNNWNRYREAMLRARCVSALARIVFPDAISGLYSRDEISDGDVAPPHGGEELRGEVVTTTGTTVAPATQAAPAAPAPVQAAAPRDFEVEADAIKERIAAASTPELRKAVRKEIATWSAEAGEPYAGDVKRAYNLLLGADKPPTAAPAANGYLPPEKRGDSYDGPEAP